MNGEKREALLGELISLAKKEHYFVSMETDNSFFRGVAPATPRVCVGIFPKEDSTRPTVTAGPMIFDHGLPNNGSVVYLTLTDREKEEICKVLSNIAQKVGVHFKLLKAMTNHGDGLLWYRFR
ncbi:MAG: hypothetical protein V4473_00565 [Patescibacteria group bacterium]